jgi:hypothetical protein
MLVETDVIVEGKLWGICERDDIGTTIRITRRASLLDFPRDTEYLVLGQLGWDPRFPDLHQIEYERIEYSIDYRSSLIYICCEEGPSEISPAVLDALGVYKYHDTTQRGPITEFLRPRYEEYRSLVGNSPHQWLAIVIQGNIQTIATDTFVCPSLSKAELSVAVVDMRDSLVKSIGEKAFVHCPNLKRVLMSLTTESIGERAFFDCEELPNSISVPRSLRTIGMTSFYVRTSVTLEIGDGVPEGERETRRLAMWQSKSIGVATHMWPAAYLVRGGRDSIARVNFIGTATEETDQQSPCCILL